MKVSIFQIIFVALFGIALFVGVLGDTAATAESGNDGNIGLVCFYLCIFFNNNDFIYI